MKIVLLKVELYNERIKQKAMKAVSGVAGVESVSVDMKEKTLTLTGNMDPVNAVGKLRKLSHTEIVSVMGVGASKEEEKKKEEPKKQEPKKEAAKKKEKEEKKADPIGVVPYDYYPTRPHHCYVSSVEEDPNACCVIF